MKGSRLDHGAANFSGDIRFAGGPELTGRLEANQAPQPSLPGSLDRFAGIFSKKTTAVWIGVTHSKSVIARLVRATHENSRRNLSPVVFAGGRHKAGHDVNA
jgi:hypothetical protein